MDNMQSIDKVLHYLMTEEGRYQIDATRFLSESLTNEHFVIYFYITEMNKRNTRLTRELLEVGMESNKLSWVDPRSKLIDTSENLTKEYLQSKTSTRLEYPQDYANTLKMLVLDTYDKIVSSQLPTEDEFFTLLDTLKNASSLVMALNLVKDIVPLINGEKNVLYFDGNRYDREDIVTYIANRSQKMLYKLNSSVDGITRKMQIWDKLSQNEMSLVPTYLWNLGKSIFSSPRPGFVVSVIAPPKVGKTRFCIGEIAYPALLLKRNVKYYSGEMGEDLLRAMLITKHIKYMLGQKLKESTVQNVLILLARIRTKKATPAEIKFFDKIPSNIKEYVVLAEQDLFYSGKYGNLKVVNIGDVDKSDITSISGDFILEEQHTLLKKEMEKMEEKDRWDVIIQDHVNHMRSRAGLKDASLIEAYYQSAKALATWEVHKSVYVVVNHLNTEQEKRIEENNSAEGLKLRGHGTNESGKSCDVELIMYQTLENRKEGNVRIQCTADRLVNIEEKFKTNEFILHADRAYCDYYFTGSGVKPPYPTAEQLDDIEELYMKNLS